MGSQNLGRRFRRQYSRCKTFYVCDCAAPEHRQNRGLPMVVLMSEPALAWLTDR